MGRRHHRAGRCLDRGSALTLGPPIWLGPDETSQAGRYLIKRATSADAAAYCLADAEMVGGAYTYTMPPQFAAARLAEVEQRIAERKVGFDSELATERRGEEPAHRTWIGWDGGEIAGIAVSTSVSPEWEASIPAAPLEGISYQLNHLYLRPHSHGSGLAQTLLDLALPQRLPAYLWLIGGNARAERFYARNGFRLDPVTYDCGPTWFHRPLHRMFRR